MDIKNDKPEYFNVGIINVYGKRLDFNNGIIIAWTETIPVFMLHIVPNKGIVMF